MKKPTVFFLVLLLAGCAALPQYLETADGVKLAHEVHSAENAKGTVLLLHGLGSNLDEWYYFSRDLNREGWATIAFDFRGHGDSLEQQGRELDWMKFNLAARESALRDVEAAAKLAEPGKPLWLMGSSFGANMAVRYGAAHPEVSGLVLLSPGLEHAGIEITGNISALNGRPVLLAAAEGDPYAAGSVKYLDEQLGEPKKMLVYEGSDGHGQAMLELIPELKKEIFAWIDRNTARN